MLAGHVTAVITNAGDLKITGDNVSNRVDVTIVDGDTIKLEDLGAGGNTAINEGAPGEAVFLPHGQLRDLKVNMKGGNDLFAIYSGFSFRKGTVKGGSGNDLLSIRGNYSRNLKLSLGSGIVGLLTWGSFDQSASTNADVGGKIIVKGGTTNDRIVFGEDVGGRVTVNSGSGNDFVRFSDHEFNGAVSVKLGAGNDDLEITNSTFFASARFNGGPGADEFIDGGSNVFAFSLRFLGFEIP